MDLWSDGSNKVLVSVTITSVLSYFGLGARDARPSAEHDPNFSWYGPLPAMVWAILVYFTFPAGIIGMDREHAGEGHPGLGAHSLPIP